MPDLRVGLFIFKLDSFESMGGVVNNYNQGKVRQPQREMYSLTVAAFNISKSIRLK